MVAGLIPYLLEQEKWQRVFSQPLDAQSFSSVTLFIAGLTIMLYCIFKFASEGKGTLSPADPTRELVVSGLYKFSRNPMYIGVMLMLIAESLFLQSRTLWIYTFCVFLGFNLFVVLHEEPRLRKDFGESYLEYCRRVRRWL
jgi:protein-S-isoprenylcysteine O-methyltransferase Ste14